MSNHINGNLVVGAPNSEARFANAKNACLVCIKRFHGSAVYSSWSANFCEVCEERKNYSIWRVSHLAPFQERSTNYLRGIVAEMRECNKKFSGATTSRELDRYTDQFILLGLLLHKLIGARNWSRICFNLPIANTKAVQWRG